MFLQENQHSSVPRNDQNFPIVFKAQAFYQQEVSNTTGKKA